MKSFAALLLPLVAAAPSLNSPRADNTTYPPPPPLTHLFTASVTASESIIIGTEAEGVRMVLPITGGTFSGALLNGTVLPTGEDAGLLRPDGNFYPAGFSVLETSDGAHIIWRDNGFQTGGAVYGAVTFETGAEQYTWLNTAVAVSSAKLTGSDSGTGVAVSVYVFGDYNF